MKVRQTLLVPPAGERSTTAVMGFQKWLWGVYEYLCFLVSGVIIAINDGNPIERLKRKYYLKWPSVRMLLSPSSP